MLQKGARFAWYFTYMPLGKDAHPDLLAEPEQRAYMYRRVRELRATRPRFAMDFWNDGEYVQGCIAGGRNYFHINANGDVEPCAFIHYANLNVRDVSLLDALRSPLFQAYQHNQPFNGNHLRPCPCSTTPSGWPRWSTPPARTRRSRATTRTWRPLRQVPGHLGALGRGGRGPLGRAPAHPRAGPEAATEPLPEHA
jgi:hypothetical protein